MPKPFECFPKAIDVLNSNQNLAKDLNYRSNEVDLNSETSYLQ